MFKPISEALAVSLITLLVVTGCQQASTAPTPPPIPKTESIPQPIPTKTYEYPNGLYSFEYPSNWTNLSTPQGPTIGGSQVEIGILQDKYTGIFLRMFSGYELITIEDTRKEFEGEGEICSLETFNGNRVLYGKLDSPTTFEKQTEMRIDMEDSSPLFFGLYAAGENYYKEFDTDWDIFTKSLTIVKEPPKTETFQAQDESYTFQYPSSWYDLYDLKSLKLSPLSFNKPSTYPQDPELVVGKLKLSDNYTKESGIMYLQVYRLTPPWSPDIEGFKHQFTVWGAIKTTTSSLNGNELLFGTDDPSLTYAGLKGMGGKIYITTIGDCYLFNLVAIGGCYQEFDSAWELLKNSLSITPSKHYVRNGKETMVGTDGHPINLETNPNAANPTWQELLNFLKQCEVDQTPYDPQNFTSGEYAEKLYNYSESAGIRSAFVVVYLYNSSTPYSLNAYQTTDKGLVFIDASGHRKEPGLPHRLYKVVDVKIGKDYLPENLFPEPGEDLVWQSPGKVKDFLIEW
jgi:hypothetical protein